MHHAVRIVFLLLNLTRYDGPPVDPDLHEWFEQQTSHGGHLPCCSEADGHVLSEEEWRLSGGTYQVFIEDKWRDVPQEAMVDPGHGPNRLAKPIVWYRKNSHSGGEPVIDCFMPGTMG